jgi:ABC-type branched-subunit amino acid transport system substrate-binding protein
MRRISSIGCFLAFVTLLCINLLDAAPIKIGVLAPLSGLGDWWGKPYCDSIILAYEEMGLTPDKVQLVIEDTQTRWPELALGLQKLINVDKVDAVLNTFDKTGYICAPILKQHHIPQLVLSLDDRSADGKTTFTLWTPVRRTTQMLLEEAVKAGHKKLALFVLRDYYPYRAELEIKKQLKNFPQLSIAHTEYFNPDERDFRTLSMKAREEEWDLAVVLAYSPTVNILTKQLIFDGVKNLTAIESFDQLQEDIKRLPEGTWWTGASENRPEFVEAFKKRFGYEPSVGPCYGYDEMKLIMKAFELNRKNPEKALPGLSVLGAGGTTTITPEGWSEMPAYLKRWENGQKVMVREWQNIDSN